VSLLMRAADEMDLPLLAQMNKCLIEDEGSRNPMSVAELQDRMDKWLRGDWKIDLLIEENVVAGYVVYQFHQDEYAPDKTMIYLRQMYIERDKRSRGLGSRALELLAQARFPADCTVVIDVLATNRRGAKFWSQVGFQPYCTTMHLTHIRNEEYVGPESRR
jgi:GNAT superfamily N-acetyltransferase